MHDQKQNAVRGITFAGAIRFLGRLRFSLPSWSFLDRDGTVVGEKPGGSVQETDAMLLRCTIDGLLVPSIRHPARPVLIAFDGDESFEMDRVEAAYYELVAATAGDLLWLQEASYRYLRVALDFTLLTHRLPA